MIEQIDHGHDHALPFAIDATGLNEALHQLLIWVVAREVVLEGVLGQEASHALVRRSGHAAQLGLEGDGYGHIKPIEPMDLVIDPSVEIRIPLIELGLVRTSSENQSE